MATPLTGTPVPASGPAAALSSSREILFFEVGGQKYGLPTADVLELVRAVSITPLPNSPEIIEGVVDVRGRVLPVLDIRARFRLPARRLDPSEHFIVAEAGTRRVILRVDRATHLAMVDAAEVQAPESLGPNAEYVAGVIRLDDGMVLIHDLATFLSAAESASIDEALTPEAPA
jgi:purine-binding chemotaxis protein CheW